MKGMRAPTKPMVDAHAPDASLWVRVRVRAYTPHGRGHITGYVKHLVHFMLSQPVIIVNRFYVDESLTGCI